MATAPTTDATGIHKLSCKVLIHDTWLFFCKFWFSYQDTSLMFRHLEASAETSELITHHKVKVWHAFSNIQHLSFSKIKTVICNINKPNKSAVKATEILTNLIVTQKTSKGENIFQTENRTLLKYYAASSGNFYRSFWTTCRSHCS